MLSDVVVETPLLHSQAFSEQLDAEIWFKLENRQHTGSFKLRGAANCLLSLSPEQRARGVVAASSGNHGAAVAYAMRSLDVPGVIFVPEQTSKAKVEAIRRYGVTLRSAEDDELHERAQGLQLRRRSGEPLEALESEGLALVGEAAWRALRQRPIQL